MRLEAAMKYLPGGAIIASLAAMAAIMGTSGAGAADVSFLSSQKQGEWLGHRLAGTKVLNAKGDMIGDVADVVLDANGQAQAIVISLGGFLGLGSKEVAVPYNSVKIGGVIEGSRLVVLDVTPEQLQAAPAYRAADPTEADRLKKQAVDWARIARDKAIELGQQASEKTKEIRQRMSTPENPQDKK
jgi:sporulation protein YlmC with PRC-barrel domain